MVVTLGQQYNAGEKPIELYCTLTLLIAMQGHQISSYTNEIKMSRTARYFRIAPQKTAMTTTPSSSSINSIIVLLII